MSRSTGLQTEQVTVIKCKNCGEILNSERDYYYTPEDLARFEAERVAEAKRSNYKFGRGVFSFLMIIGFIWFLVAAIPWNAQLGGRTGPHIPGTVGSVIIFGVSLFMYSFFNKKL